MKVPLSVRSLYQDLLPRYTELKRLVDALLLGHKELGWHYESRVKTDESFALKLETGRVKDPQKLEDFFACTIVVANRQEIARATSMVEGFLPISNRRPKNSKKTHKNSESFPFDDLRLYCSWQDSGKTTGLEGFIFEVQIKTFLQHAWGIATHDLVYKNDEKNWGKERIAFQLKAMLEHAEVSIQQASLLAESDGLAIQNDISESVSKIIHWQKATWETALLPLDQKRMAENLRELCLFIGIPLRECFFIVEKEKKERGLQSNLSPYTTVLDILLREKTSKFLEALTSLDGAESPFRVFVPKEINLPSQLAAVNSIRWVRL